MCCKGFRILKDYRTWVIAREDAPHEFHAHFTTKEGCYKLLRMYTHKIRPRCKYFRKAMQRITTQQEWESFTEENTKQRYFNSQKGVIKKRG